MNPNPFETTIKAHLDKVAAEDPQFAEKYRAGLAGKKDIAACGRYIITQVRKIGREGFTDQEIYGMAVHFYDEEDLTAPGSAPGCKVVVNHEIQLSAAEVKKIQDDARREVEEKVRREELARIEKERQEAEKRARKAEEARKRAEERRKAKAEEEAARKAEERRRLDEEDLLFRFDMEG